MYLVCKKLLVPSGPDKIPSAMRFMPGNLIEFDGDEPIDLKLLERSGAIMLYDEHNPDHYRRRVALAGVTMKAAQEATAAGQQPENAGPVELDPVVGRVPRMRRRKEA